MAKFILNEGQKERIIPQIVVISFTLALASVLFYLGKIYSAIETLISMILPFLAGFAIAFLLSPIQRYFTMLLKKTFFKRKRRSKGIKALSAAFSLISLILFVSVFLTVLLPQMFRSVTSIVSFLYEFLEDNSDAVTNLLVKFGIVNFDGDELAVLWEDVISNQYDNITAIIGNIIIISGTVVNSLYQVLLSLITAFYIMLDKERLAAQCKKLSYALFQNKTAETLIYWSRRASTIFSGFIIGKIIDSLIIGCICYGCMLLFGFSYPILISCIICVTNLIPFFGPFIGWAPCALILLLVDPMEALWFSGFIVVLQQIDGNIIGPRILGNYVGVSALSIMISIVIGGNLFGFVGMLLAVPVYALVYSIIKTWAGLKLLKKGMPMQTENYYAMPNDLEERYEEEI